MQYQATHIPTELAAEKYNSLKIVRIERYENDNGLLRVFK